MKKSKEHETVISFTTVRRDGHARDPGALERLLKKYRCPGRVATAQQIHKSYVAVVRRLAAPKLYAKVDGLLTDQIDQPLAIFTADCVPVFLTATSAGVVGLLHAGWRGVQSCILKKAVQEMRRRWHVRSGDITIWTGPAIGPCCFEVRWDVAQYFPRARKRRGDRWMIDLDLAIRQQARSLGIKFKSRPGARRCTMHDRRYFSYRRDGTADRQVSVIVKTNE